MAEQAQLFLALEKHHEAVFTVFFIPALAGELRAGLGALEAVLAREGGPTQQKGTYNTFLGAFPFRLGCPRIRNQIFLILQAPENKYAK